MKNLSTTTKVLIGLGILVAVLVGLEIFQQATDEGNLPKVEGINEVTVETQTLLPFNKLIVSSRMELELKKGEPKIVTELDKNLHELLRYEQKDGVLRMFRKSVNYESENKFIVTVFAQDLNHVEVRNYGRLTSTELFATDSMSIQIGNRSKVSLEIECAKLKVDLQDHSDLTLKGSATDADVFLEGSSHLSGVDLSVDNAEVFMRNRSYTNLNIKNSLKGKGTDRSKMFIINPIDTSQYLKLDDALIEVNASKSLTPWKDEK